jgi:hypothetical protein
LKINDKKAIFDDDVIGYADIETWKQGWLKWRTKE